MTRVVLFPSSYLPALGGVEELTRHLALALRERCNAVELWGPRAAATDPPSTEVLDGIVLRRFGLPLPAQNLPALWAVPRFGVPTVLAMRRAIKSFRPDVIHVQCFGPNGAYATMMSKLTGVPLVLSLQGETVMDDGDIFSHSLVLRRALRLGLAHASVVTGCSSFTLRDAETRFGLRSGRGAVVFNGVDLQPNAKTPTGERGERRFSRGRPYVLGLGRIVENKGFDLLLLAWRTAARDAPGVDLVIAGEGAVRPKLEALAQQLGIADRVHFSGRLNRAEVAEVMSDAELFVMPSRVEPFGIVVLEAFRAGRAVIATSRGGPPEFITDGIDGRLVDPFDQTRLAAVIVELLLDDAQCQLLGANARCRLDEFAWSKIAASYEALYLEASAGKDGVRRTHRRWQRAR